MGRSLWLLFLLWSAPLLVAGGCTGDAPSSLQLTLDLSSLGRLQQAQTQSHTDKEGRFLLDQAGLYLRIHVKAPDLSSPLTRIFPSANEKIPEDGKLELSLEVPAGKARTFDLLLLPCYENQPVVYYAAKPLQKDLSAEQKLTLDVQLVPLPARPLDITLQLPSTTIQRARLLDSQEKIFLPWIEVHKNRFQTDPRPIGRSFSLQIESTDGTLTLLQTLFTVEEGSSPQTITLDR